MRILYAPTKNILFVKSYNAELITQKGLKKKRKSPIVLTTKK